MISTQLYLPTVLPQWGIFAGVILLTVGYVDKKDLWTRIGWIVLIATSLAALYFNLFGGLKPLAETNTMASLLISTGWQTAAGGALAAVSLLMLQYKKKRYALLAILTICYFTLTFFLYTQVSATKEITIKSDTPTEQKQQIYVSPMLWETIRGARENLIGIINRSAEEVGQDAPALSLSKKIIEIYIDDENDAIVIAMNELKKEIGRLF